MRICIFLTAVLWFSNAVVAQPNELAVIAPPFSSNIGNNGTETAPIVCDPFGSCYRNHNLPLRWSIQASLKRIIDVLPSSLLGYFEPEPDQTTSTFFDDIPSVNNQYLFENTVGISNDFHQQLVSTSFNVVGIGSSDRSGTGIAQLPFSLKVTEQTYIDSNLGVLSERNQLKYPNTPSDGILFFTVSAAKNRADGLSGTDLWNKAILYYGQENIRGVYGDWVYGDNLNIFLKQVNRLTRRGRLDLSPKILKQSAFSTWTGRKAASLGLENTIFLKLNLDPQEPGINVLFF